MPASKNAWLSPEEWAQAQHQMPIACVDALPIRLSSERGSVESVGLILRHTAIEGDRWCLTGGRILHGETVSEAIDRHVRTTLGDAVTWHSGTGEQPLWVHQYFPDPRVGYGLDPRQHAVALTYAVRLQGDPAPKGEALDFRWFDVAELDRVPFGFGQGDVARACLTALERD